MEVKPGYKQTEVGVIPEDWDVRKLSQISWFQEGPGLRNWQFTTSGMKVINVTNLDKGVLNLDRTDRYISVKEFNQMYRHFEVETADIVMASSGNSYSKTAIVRPQDLPLVMNTSVIRFKPARGCDYGFLWALLNSPQFKQQIDLTITGGAQPNFGPYHLKRINVPFPPPPEQRAIAEALSDVDGLLGGLDRSIAKKRDLKQAAVQQLLSRQTRLPGFDGDWVVKRMGELTQLYQSETIGQAAFTEDGFPVYGANGIIGRYSRYNHSTPQITISCRGNCGTVNRTEQFSWITGNAMVVNLDENKSVDRDFMFHLLKSQDFSVLVTGSGQPQIVRGPLAEFQIRLPAQRAEQTAIAELLTEMDMELAALEQRREKTRGVKQAMMQELLTGKTRLVAPEPVHA